MPNAAPKPCKHAGCRALVTSGAYCDIHKKKKQQQTDSARLSSTQRGYGYRWQKVSKGYLKSHPLCVCDKCQGGKFRIRAAEVVDHIIPHGGDMKLFWDPDNWQPMAKECHDRKTATQDGGFRGR